jgi:hypothetical protein
MMMGRISDGVNPDANRATERRTALAAALRVHALGRRFCDRRWEPE